MGFFKKIKKQIRKAVRKPSHSRTAAFLLPGTHINKYTGKVMRRLGVSKKGIFKAIGLNAGSSQPVMYNSAAAYQPRRISSLMGGAA